jgi:hypothetical protein
VSREKKILQIIPVPADVLAVYREDDGTRFAHDDIVCLALVEEIGCDSKAVRYVDAVVDNGELLSDFSNGDGFGKQTSLIDQGIDCSGLAIAPTSDKSKAP